MANTTKDRGEKAAQDERYNPGAEHERNHVENRHNPESVNRQDPRQSADQDQYDAAFNEIANNPDNSDLRKLKDAEENPDSGRNAGSSAPSPKPSRDKSGTVADREQQASTPWKTDMGSGGNTSGSGSRKKTLMAVGIFGGVGLGLIGTFVMLLNLFLINFKELTTEWSMKRNWTRTAQRASKNFEKRWMSEPQDCKGIRCRGKQGISQKDVDRLERSGAKDIKTAKKKIKVNGVEKEVVYIKSFKMNGVEGDVTKANFKENFKKYKGVKQVVSRGMQTQGKFTRTTKTALKLFKLGAWGKNWLNEAKSKKDMLKKFREKMVGKSGNELSADGKRKNEKGEETSTTDGLNDKVKEAAAKAREEALDPDKRPPGVSSTDVGKAAEFGKGAIKGVGRSLSITGAVSAICEAYTIFKGINYATKFFRMLNLIRAFGAFVVVADALKVDNGTLTNNFTPAHINFLAMLLLTPDSEGRTFFDGPGMQYLMFKKIPSKESVMPYATGTPQAAAWRNLGEKFRLGGASDKVCGVVNSAAFQIGSAVLSIGLAFFSGGTSLIASGAAGIAGQIILSAVEDYAIPLAIKYLSGTEFANPTSYELGSILPAGATAAAAQVGRAQGLSPLPAPQAAADSRETAQLYDSYFGDQKPGITTKVAMNVSTFFSNFMKPATYVTPQGSFAAATANASPSSFAIDQVQPTSTCDDPEIKAMNIATDAFCNPIYSESTDVLEAEKDGFKQYEEDNVVNYMVDNGHVDEDSGEPKSEEFKKYSDICMDGTAALVPSTVSAGDYGEVSPQEECVNDTDQKKFFRMYRMDGNINEDPDELAKLKGSGAGEAAVAGGPYGWPVQPSSKGRITSCQGFTEAESPGRGAHSGLDIAAPIGTDIVAPADGKVVFSGKANGYGSYLAIEHADNNTGYGHVVGTSIKDLKVGATVKKGQVIAKVGNEGQSTGPHLHLNLMPKGTIYAQTSNRASSLNPLTKFTKPADVKDEKGCVGKVKK